MMRGGGVQSNFVGQRPAGPRGRPGGEALPAQPRPRACPGGLTDFALASLSENAELSARVLATRSFGGAS